MEEKKNQTVAGEAAATEEEEEEAATRRKRRMKEEEAEAMGGGSGGFSSSLLLVSLSLFLTLSLARIFFIPLLPAAAAPALVGSKALREQHPEKERENEEIAARAAD